MTPSPEDVRVGKEADMNPAQAAEHLRAIRELMERPLRCTTRSGASAVAAGLLALAGCGVTWLLTGGQIWSEQPNMPAVGLVWLTVLASAATVDLFLVWRRARALGVRYWKRAQRQTALAIAPGFVIGGIVTWAVVTSGHNPGGEFDLTQYGLVPAVWMVFYGMAAWSVGLFSPIEVKLLGAAFMAAGILGVHVVVDHPIAAMAATFGGFHIIYGIVVWRRHGG